MPLRPTLELFGSPGGTTVALRSAASYTDWASFSGTPLVMASAKAMSLLVPS